MQTETGISPMPAYEPSPNVEEQGTRAQSAAPAQQEAAKSGSSVGKFFGVYLDRRTWGALAYALTSLLTGVLYFTWAVAGLSLSISFLVLIIGLPFAVLFLMSVRGLAYLEGRLVESLLGAKTQGQAIRAGGSGLTGRLKSLVTDRHTWDSLVLLVLQLPLSVINFTIVVVALVFSLSLMALPVAFWSADQQSIMIGSQIYTMRAWIPIAMEFAGFLLLTISLHVVRAIGRQHGKYAQALLGR